jgi:hypothetical protein
MILKSAVLISALRVAFSQLKTTMSAAEYQKILLKAQAGNFLRYSDFFDAAGVSDASVLAFFKTFTDTAGAAEFATRAFAKSLADAGYATDAAAFETSKPAEDIAAATDTFVRDVQYNRALANAAAAQDLAFLGIAPSFADTLGMTDAILAYILGKSLFETPTATDEVNSFSITKTILDQATATDDLDGTATPLDDQELQFVKVKTNIAAVSDLLFLSTGFNRAFSESPTLTDDDVFNFGKLPSDTISATDAGSLRSQGYSDFTYFLEDFVGASQTFT